jgi:hypothetical protein
MCKLEGSLISWFSMKELVVTLSSCESEYISTSLMIMGEVILKRTYILKLIIQNNVAKKIYIPPIEKGAL